LAVLVFSLIHFIHHRSSYSPLFPYATLFRSYYASLYENDEAVIQEVTVYFEYKLLRGNRTLKYSAEYFDAYQSPNYPTLGQSGVHLNIEKDFLYRPIQGKEFAVDDHISRDVLFWRIFPGMHLDHFEE